MHFLNSMYGVTLHLFMAISNALQHINTLEYYIPYIRHSKTLPPQESCHSPLSLFPKIEDGQRRLAVFRIPETGDHPTVL